MTKNPKVSVFVQVYNTERYVKECLRSVLTQDFEGDLEVIVIDDGSTDSSWSIIESFEDKRLRAIRHSPNQGANATANEGYLTAKGEFILRIDSDDRLRPGFLHHSLSLIQADDRIGFTYADIRLIDNEGAVTSNAKNVHRGAGLPIRDELFHLLSKNYVPAPTTLVRRTALQSVLPIPPEFNWLDWYVTTSVAYDWLVGFIDQPLADYRVHIDGMHTGAAVIPTDERISMAVLGAAFGRKGRSKEKSRLRRDVYKSVYLDLADKYFGCSADARRLYTRAILSKPSALLERGIARRWLGSILGIERYARVKAILKN